MNGILNGIFCGVDSIIGRDRSVPAVAGFGPAVVEPRITHRMNTAHVALVPAPWGAALAAPAPAARRAPMRFPVPRRMTTT